MASSSKCISKTLTDNIVTVSNLWDAASISTTLDALDNASYEVNTLKELPSASCNAGRFVYVKEISEFRYSDGYNWILNTCTVEGVSNLNTLWTWGGNGQGVLGDGTTVDRCSPGTVAGGGNWQDIDSSHTNLAAAIKTDGTLWTWGSANAFGSLGIGVAGAGRCSPGTVAGGGTTWCQVSSSGFSFISAIKTDGTLWTWGDNTCGVLGNGTTVDRCSPGTVAGGGTNWCQVSGKILDSTFAIKTDGTLWTWGCNNTGVLGDGTTVNRCSPGTIAGGGTTWSKISNGGRFHGAAIKTDGTLWTWGCNTNGELGDGTTVSRCSPGTVAGGGTNWCQVSGGCLQVAAIKTDGTLWTWGQGTYGQLGNGTTLNRCSPGTVAGEGTTWCQVNGGKSSTAAIKTDGTLWTWGNNQCGQLGNGTVTSRCSPGTVAGGGTTWCKTIALDCGCGMFAIRTRGF